MSNVSQAAGSASSAHPREKADAGLWRESRSLAPGSPRGLRRLRMSAGMGLTVLGAATCRRSDIPRPSNPSASRVRRGDPEDRRTPRVPPDRCARLSRRRRASCGAPLLRPCDGGGPARVRPLLGLAVAREFPRKPLKRLIPRPEIQRQPPPTGNAAKIRRGRACREGRHRAAREFGRKALKRLISRPETRHPCSSARGRGQSPGAGGANGRGRIKPPGNSAASP